MFHHLQINNTRSLPDPSPQEVLQLPAPHLPLSLFYDLIVMADHAQTLPILISRLYVFSASILHSSFPNQSEARNHHFLFI